VVELEPVSPRLRAQVLALAPHPDQERFSGRATRTLPVAEANPDHQPVVVLDDGTPVGFFVLDAGPEVARFAPGPGRLGLRSFFVDRRHQGRGVGLAALRAVPAFARAHHPGRGAVALTVNTQNTAALRVYLRAGFRDTGRLFHGGPYGPQHVLELDVLEAQPWPERGPPSRAARPGGPRSA
jgi:RimJ/RimL family protein N-acetyltransferase